MSLLEIATTLFRYRIKILIIFFSVLAVAIAVTFMMKPVYEAKSTLLIKMVKEDSGRPGMGGDDRSLPLTLTQDEIINTEIQILSGRELAVKVIKTLQVSRMYPEIAANSKNVAVMMDQAVRAFQASLKVFGVRKSNVLTVAFQHGNPEIAAKAVNQLVEEFERKHLELHSDPQSSFIETELSALRQKLNLSQKELQQYQQDKKVFSLEEQRSLLLNQRTQFDSAYKTAANEVKELSNKVAVLKGRLGYLSSNNTNYTNTERDKIITDAQTKLLDLQLKEHELRRKYTESNRLVVEVKKEQEMVHRFLQEQERSIGSKVKSANPVFQGIQMDLFRAEAELKSQGARANALKAQISKLDEEIAVLDTNESKIQNLKRNVAIDEKNYMTYAGKYEEARLTAAMNQLKMSNITVMEPAVTPIKPIKPKKKVYLMFGALVAMASALGYAYLAYALSQSFYDPESVEKYLECPVLATVPCKEIVPSRVD